MLIREFFEILKTEGYPNYCYKLMEGLCNLLREIIELNITFNKLFR